MNCCRSCGHVYNSAYGSAMTEYSGNYENSLFFSHTYMSYASALAEDLVARLDLRAKRIVEVGCGSGDFLKLLCDKGGNEGIGFDPSIAAGLSVLGNPRITVVRDHYSSKHTHIKADLVCCRHVLEHVELPRAFLKEIIRALPDGKRAALFFEVPDVLFILKGHSGWDLIYEHPSCFSMSSLQRLFVMAGCRVEEIWSSFHNQFLCMLAIPDRDDPGCGEVGANGCLKEVIDHAHIFSDIFRAQVKTWAQRLHAMRRFNERVVLWGAGSKGVTFLNILQGDGSIDYVVDINDRKQGMFIPGTGQEIVSPSFLSGYKPDAVIVMNPAYEVEVRRNLQVLGLQGRVLPIDSPERDGGC